MTDRTDWPVRKTTLADQGEEDDMRRLSPAERMALVWPLTVSCWAMRGESIAEQELQRDVVRVERRGR